MNSSERRKPTQLEVGLHALDRIKYLGAKYDIDILQIWKDFGVLNGKVDRPIDEIKSVVRDKIIGRESGKFGTPEFKPGAWRNISKHNLFVAGAVRSLAAALNVEDEEDLDRLEMAGLLHDAGKRAEIIHRNQAKQEGVDVLEAIDRAGQAADEKLTQYNVPEEIISIFPHFGEEYFKKIDNIIKRLKSNQSVEDKDFLAFLLIFADYCIGGDEQPRIATTEERGEGIARRCRTDEERSIAAYDQQIMLEGRAWICKELGIKEEEFRDFLEEKMIDSVGA